MSLTLEELKWATILALTEPPQRSTLGEAPVENPYLTFYSPDGEFSIRSYYRAKTWDGVLEYSTDTITWIEWPGNTTLSSSDGYLYMRGTGNTRITRGYRWVLSGTNISCTGNIENLLDYATTASGNHPNMITSCYQQLFDGCTALTTAPELPATLLSQSCYSGMFRGCTNLTVAPELPATLLSGTCYAQMFYGCTSLTSAPNLPATTLAVDCYEAMFYGCTSLTTAPELPATVLESRCYGYMFYGCTSLTTAPELPATILADDCYAYMFRDCTSLIEPPELPATTLAVRCYYQMFDGCTSLIILPELPATVLMEGCYQLMFDDCHSLKISATPGSSFIYEYRIPTVGMGTTATNALTNMFLATGGPFTGTPAINTTYYTDHEPV